MTLGEAIYSDINNSEYLSEIYDNILYNYSLLLFHKDEVCPKQINVSHALRFADILSKSTDSKFSERHKSLAQEMVALLHTMYPDNKDVEYYIGSILTNVNNYMGLSLQNPKYQSADIFDELYNGIVKEKLQIPCESSLYFFKSQKDVYDRFQNIYFSYSGPTSMGKSFVMRMFIKQQIINNTNKNYAILIPTKALINEVSGKIIEDLKDLLNEHNYRIVTSAGALSLQQSHNFVLVLTPERLLYLLLDRPDFIIDYLFVDEAHKISSKDKRSPFYYKVVDMLTKNNPSTHVFFSSPNIPNPEVYLKLVANKTEKRTDKIACSYTPVSQMKYTLNLLSGQAHVYNNLNDKLTTLNNGFITTCSSLSKLINTIGAKTQNIVYCNSTFKAVMFAIDFANNLPIVGNDQELESLIKEIKNEIHSEYYLVDVLSKGVAYHIGYLPSNIRQQIEILYKSGTIKTMFCTSTLVEGVNLPADNLFITSYKNGRSKMGIVDFKNLIGRVGRIEYNLYGNVFLVTTDENTNPQKYEELLQAKIPEQKLSLISELTKPQKQKIIDNLVSGNVEFLKHPATQTDDNYSLMRKFAIILLKDIVSGNKDSYVRSQFSYLLTGKVENKIKQAFNNKTKIDDDINISIDQVDNLIYSIQSGLSYPSDFNFTNSLMPFLNKLSMIFKWDKYEADTLGNHGKLRWYAVILAQWMQGYGLSLIVESSY